MELICAECKNKWMPSNRINEVICPYCGNIIGELSRDFSSFEDGIAYIRNMFGDDIFEQRRFFFICTEYLEMLYAQQEKLTSWSPESLIDINTKLGGDQRLNKIRQEASFKYSAEDTTGGLAFLAAVVIFILIIIIIIILTYLLL